MGRLYNHTTKAVITDEWAFTVGGDYISCFTILPPKPGDILAMDCEDGSFPTYFRAKYVFNGNSAVSSIIQVSPLDNLEIMGILGKTDATHSKEA